MKKNTIYHPLQFAQVRVENTNLCTYKCVMCPREKQTRKTGIMTMEDLDIVLDRIRGGVEEIHLHGYGEPLLDRQLLPKARRVKQRFPDAGIAFITTLGVSIPDTFFSELAGSGVSIVGISCYGFTPATYRAVHGVDHFKVVCENLKQMVAEKSRSGNPFEMFVITTSEKAWQDVSEQEMAIRRPFLEWMRSSGIHLNENFSPHNYGDGREYIKPKVDGTCSIVWGARRDILQIT